MRKVLISTLLVALIALLVLIGYQGVEVAGFKLGYPVKEILDKNNELDNGIVVLKNRIDREYTLAKTNLDSSFSKLQAEKQRYEQTISYTTEEDLEKANTQEEYKLDYLWTKIGLYATQNNIIMKADVSHGSSGVANQYNISFTTIGEYLSISEFVHAIEKDDTLGFRIEEFSVVPHSNDNLQATFIIKNVAIDPNSLSNSSSVSTGTVTTNQNAKSSETVQPEEQ